MKSRPIRSAIVLLAVVTAAVGGQWYYASHKSETNYVARNVALRAIPLYFYPATDSTTAPKAFIFFLGNDVGFWQPHHQLAAILAADGYAVAGYDMKPLLASLPETEPARDSVFGVRISEVIARAQAELHAEALPVIVGGHSLGAEVAVWIAAHTSIPGMKGVLSVSPGSRSHLRVSAADIANSSEPTDAESFAVSDAVRDMPPTLHLAIIRGANDRYVFADSALLVAGAGHAKRFIVPLAGHSLKSLFVARFVVRTALTWILTP